jgi:hypothetical protein
MMYRMIRRAAQSGSRPATQHRVPQRPSTARQRRSDAAGLKVASWMCLAIMAGLTAFIIVTSLNH